MYTYAQQGSSSEPYNTPRRSIKQVTRFLAFSASAFSTLANCGPPPEVPPEVEVVLPIFQMIVIWWAYLCMRLERGLANSSHGKKSKSEGYVYYDTATYYY